MARVLVYPSFDSKEAIEDTCDQRTLRSDCADAQADPGLRWPHKSYCRSCGALAQIVAVIRIFSINSADIILVFLS